MTSTRQQARPREKRSKRPRKRRPSARPSAADRKRRQLEGELRHAHCEEHKYVSRICRAWSELDRVRHQLQAIYRDLARVNGQAINLPQKPQTKGRK